MVNSETAISADSKDPVSGDGDQPALIDDQTPPEVIAQEEAFMRGEDPSEQAGDDAGAEEKATGEVDAEVTEPLAATQEPTPKPPEPEKPEETEEARISRLIDERTATLQSSFDRRVAEAEKTARLAQEENAKFSLEAQVEAELRRQTQALTTDMGEEAATRVVRSEQNAKSVKDTFTTRSENERLQTEITESTVSNRSYLMVQWLDTVKAENGLSDADVLALRGMVGRESLTSDEAFRQTGEAIGNMAKRLRTNAPASPKAQVPPENPATAPGDGRSTSASPTTDESLTAAAQNKPGWAWTKEEHAAMQRASYGGMR